MNFFIDNYVWFKISLALFSCLLSFVFVIWFFIKKKNISNVEINGEKMNDYIGKESFFRKEYCKDREKTIKKLKNGLSKNLRFFYSTWLCVFIFTGFLYFTFTIQCFKEMEFTKLEEIINKGDIKANDDAIFKKYHFAIIADIESESPNYDIEKETIKTPKNFLEFPLKMRIKSPRGTIIRDYPLNDKITVDFTLKNTEIARFIDSISQDAKTVHLIDSVLKKDSSYPFGKDSIIALLDSVSQDRITIRFVDNIFKDTIIVQIIDSVMKRIEEEEYKGKIKTFKSDTHNIPLKCKISREKKIVHRDIETLTSPEGEELKIKKDTNIFIHEILLLDTIFAPKYYGFFEKSTLPYGKIKNLINTLKQQKKDLDSSSSKSGQSQHNGKKDDSFTIKPVPVKNVYATFVTIFSLLANVFLMLFFGFLNTKTDLFAKEKDSNTYVTYKYFVIGIFIVIVLIQLLITFFPQIQFSDSFIFVIRTIIALTSIIAVFGCWGSMNNSYSSFYPFFKFLMLFYAMSQIFGLNIDYTETSSFNKAAELFLLLVALVARWLIIYILLVKFPKNKRALWYFFTSTNNYRTINDYEDFVKIFDTKNKLPRSRVENYHTEFLSFQLRQGTKNKNN